jgi:hypothetical protein
MKQKLNFGTTIVANPTANITVNKSRLKVYNKESNIPTYYLEKGQEFEIELFNPTKDTILAKISLNDNLISQGGLVLRPGERIFLDRYLDVAKKFLFDTYEVSNTEEVKEAIKNNGDFKVQFFRETKTLPLTTFRSTSWDTLTQPFNQYSRGTSNFTDLTNVNLYNSSITDSLGSNITYSTNSLSLPKSSGEEKALRGRGFSKKLETGRIEKGSSSDQKLKTVNLEFECFPSHTVEYKMLPISQKINTSDDLNIRRYCTNCGAKLHKDHKFCGHCGTKV